MTAGQSEGGKGGKKQDVQLREGWGTERKKDDAFNALQSALWAFQTPQNRRRCCISIHSLRELGTVETRKAVKCRKMRCQELSTPQGHTRREPRSPPCGARAASFATLSRRLVANKRHRAHSCLQARNSKNISHLTNMSKGTCCRTWRNQSFREEGPLPRV